MKYHSIKKRIKKLAAILIGIPLFWFLVFIYYPLNTMTDVKGTIVESQHIMGHAQRLVFLKGYTYAIKLNNYISPIRLKTSEEIDFFDGDILGTQVTVQIQKKDIEKINTFTLHKPLEEYSDLELWELPRMYGIETDNGVVITSLDALVDVSTPSVLADLYKCIGILVLIFAIYILVNDIRNLYKLKKQYGE